MIINRANLDTLFTAYMSKFSEAQKKAAERPWPNALMVEDIALVLPVTGAGTVHSWLEQIKSIHEWVGDRVLQNIRVGQLAVTNRAFENTVSVKRHDIEDDQYGMFAPLIGMMGADAEGLWAKLAAEALAGNGTWADGNPFFCAARAVGESEITNASADALSKASAEAALAAIRGWTLAGGEPADAVPECLVVGPALEGSAKSIVEAEIEANAAGTLAVSNVSPARALKVRVDARIAGSRWYITCRKGGIPAVAVQKRKLPTLARLDRDTDENVFMRGEYLYGTDARGEAFMTLPFLAYAGGLPSVPAWDGAKVPA
jgi:phage major head subunit gpT-like protein